MLVTGADSIAPATGTIPVERGPINSKSPIACSIRPFQAGCYGNFQHKKGVVVGRIPFGSLPVNHSHTAPKQDRTWTVIPPTIPESHQLWGNTLGLDVIMGGLQILSRA